MALALAVLTLAAVATADAMSSSGTATVKVQSSRYGKILFDGHGRAIYLFARDRKSHSSCYGACATAWPPLLSKGAPKGLRGVDAKLLGTTKRKDGTSQVTYAKHPLYYFKNDVKPGQITCQNVSEFGGLWLVVAPSGKPVR